MQDKIDEALVDVLFKTLRMNLKTHVTGEVIEFKLYITDNKSLFSLRVRKNTFKEFISWVNSIDKEV